ncbi:MAG: DUF3857 and transglutaminase domain-containing protein [Candidatus Omnitrophica bacterium]|nr:DUF3857 and transglutaminase domain-containing protein [Candidatus Omnitrophota bacterium]
MEKNNFIQLKPFHAWNTAKILNKIYSFFIVAFLTVITGCATMSEQDKFILNNLQESGITGKIQSNWWTGSVDIFDVKRGFNFDDEKVNWYGVIYAANLFNTYSAHWISPDGKIALKTKCVNPGLNKYYATMPIKGFVDPKQQGEWQVKILDKNSRVIDTQMFYIGMNNDGELAWSDTTYDISDAAAVKLLEDVSIEYTKGYVAHTKVRKKIKILKEDGKKWAEVVIPVINGLENLSINYAHTILPDGKIVPAEQGGFTMVFENYPSYIARQVYLIAMKGVEIGATIEYEYEKIEMMPSVEGMLFEGITFSDEIPVVKYQFQLTVPQEFKIQFKNYNHNREPKENVGDDLITKVFKWSGENIKPMRLELYMPPYKKIGELTLISSVNNWEDIRVWWNNLIEKNIKSSDEIKNKVAELTAGLDNDNDKVSAIYEYVQQNIRYAGFTFGLSSYVPNNSESVFQSKYGDCKDKTVLLITMLREAGFESYSALTPTRFSGIPDLEFPSMQQFYHVIAAVKMNEHWKFLDPTAENFSFDDMIYTNEGSHVYVVKNDYGKFEEIPYSSVQSNRINTKIILNVNEDLTVDGSLRINWNGQNNGLTRTVLKLTEKDQRDQYLRQIIQNIYPYARIKNMKVINENDKNKPLALEAEFQLNDIITQADDVLVLKSFGDMGSIVPVYLMEDIRIYPIHLEYRNTTELEIDIHLPKNVKVHKLPEDFSFESVFLQSKIAYTQSDRGIIQKQFIKEINHKIPAEDFKKLKSDWEKVAQAHRKNILIKQSK